MFNHTMIRHHSLKYEWMNDRISLFTYMNVQVYIWMDLLIVRTYNSPSWLFIYKSIKVNFSQSPLILFSSFSLHSSPSTFFSTTDPLRRWWYGNHGNRESVQSRYEQTNRKVTEECNHLSSRHVSSRSSCNLNKGFQIIMKKIPSYIR